MKYSSNTVTRSEAKKLAKIMKQAREELGISGTLKKKNK